jgi:hypothetical protein
VTAGDWAIAIQFRRDSTKPLERIDWMQQVRGERDTLPITAPSTAPDSTP